MLEKLKIFESELNARDKVAQKYTRALSGVFETPMLIEDVTSAWAQYTLKLDDRDAVQARLKECNVPSVVYYPTALSVTKLLTDITPSVSGVSVSESLSGRVLSLPMHPYLDELAQGHIISSIMKTCT